MPQIKLRGLKLIVVLLVGLLFMTGCQSGGGGEETPVGPITLQWWGVFWDPAVVSSLIEEYQSQNPNVKIEYANKWPGGNREIAAKLYQDELNRVLRERNPVAIPDIFMVENTWAGKYEGVTAPAPASVIDVATMQTAFYPVVAKDFVRNDTVRGIPLWIDTLAVLYNKDLLAAEAVSAPPDDWVDFTNLAKELTARSSGAITQAGFAAGKSRNVSFGVELLYLILLQNGVAMTDTNGNPAFATDSDTEVGLDFYLDFAASSTGTWNSSQKNDGIAFLEGDLAMLVAPSWRYHDLLTFNKTYDLDLDIGVAPMPQLQSQNQPRLNWATYWGNMVALDRPNTTEAWKFLRWLSEPAQLRKLRANEKLNREFFGFLYPRTDMQQELVSDTYLREFNSALPYTDSWNMVDGLAVRAIFEELIEESTSASASQISSTENEVQQVVNSKGSL